MKRVFLDECHNAPLCLTESTALRAGILAVEWNRKDFSILFLAFGHFVGGEAAGGRQKTLRLLSPKGELENPQSGPALDSVLPTECAEDEVHDKEGAKEDEGAEVDPRPR